MRDGWGLHEESRDKWSPDPNGSLHCCGCPALAICPAECISLITEHSS